MRLFIAIDFPEEIMSTLNADLLNIKGVKWVKPEQIHLTLKFIGDYPDDKIDNLLASLGRIDFSAFALTLSDAGFFPNSRRPSVFWLGVETSLALVKLKKELEGLLDAECGIPPDERKFIPHATLARIKSRVAPALTEKLQGAFASLHGKTFECRRFILFSSQLERAGAIHKVLGKFPRD